MNEQFPEKMCQYGFKVGQFTARCYMLDNIQQTIWVYTIMSSTSPWTNALANRQFAGQCPANCLAKSNMLDIIQEVCDLFLQNGPCSTKNAHQCSGVRQCVGQFIAKVILFNRYQFATTYFTVLFN